jgi:hypothetical protein
MPAAKRWTVDVYIGEDDQGHTYAEARLHTGARTTLVGVGHARLQPGDTEVPEIGDELATARALSDLGHRLLVTTADDIHGITHQDVTLRA